MTSVTSALGIADCISFSCESHFGSYKGSPRVYCFKHKFSWRVKYAWHGLLSCAFNYWDAFETCSCLMAWKTLFLSGCCTPVTSTYFGDLQSWSQPVPVVHLAWCHLLNHRQHLLPNRKELDLFFPPLLPQSSQWTEELLFCLTPQLRTTLMTRLVS